MLNRFNDMRPQHSGKPARRWNLENIANYRVTDMAKEAILKERQIAKFRDCMEMDRPEYADNVLESNHIDHTYASYCPARGNCRGCFSTGPMGFFCSKCYNKDYRRGNQDNNDMFVLFETANGNIWIPERLEMAMNQTPDPYPLKEGHNLCPGTHNIVYKQDNPANWEIKYTRGWVVYRMEFNNPEEDATRFFDVRSTQAGEMFWVTHFRY